MNAIALVADAVRKVESMWKSRSRNWSCIILGLATPEYVRAAPKAVPARREGNVAVAIFPGQGV